MSEDNFFSQYDKMTIGYTFPLRENYLVRLKLPYDLTVEEVERLYTFLKTLPAPKEEESAGGER